MFGTDDNDHKDEQSGAVMSDSSKAKPADSSADSSCTRPLSSGVLSFHNGTEDALYYYVKSHSKQGDALGVLRAIDDFCYTQHWMMHVGDQKLPILKETVTAAMRRSVPHPATAVELGSYCGYSAIFLASQLDASNGDRLFCIENNKNCVNWTRRMVEFAGLADIVTVIESCAAKCGEWRDSLPKNRIDYLFIDHDKSQYLSALQAIENEGLLGTGSIVVADNVLSFGKPLTEYLKYVRDIDGPFDSSTLHEGFIEYSHGRGLPKVEDSNFVDGVEVSIHK